MAGKVVFIEKETKNMINVGYAYVQYAKTISVNGFEAPHNRTSKWSLDYITIGDEVDFKKLLSAGYNIGLLFSKESFDPMWSLNDDLTDAIENNLDKFLKKNPSFKITADNYSNYVHADGTDPSFTIFLLPVDFDISALKSTFEVPDSAIASAIKEINKDVADLIRETKVYNSNANNKKGGTKAETLIRQIKDLQKQLNEYK